MVFALFSDEYAGLILNMSVLVGFTGFEITEDCPARRNL